MQKNKKSLLKNFSYSFGSNLLVMIISAFGALIIPKFISVEDYGYWQLFIFYSSYVSFTQFGWDSGIYLRYGGMEFDNLDKTVVKGQIVWFMISQFIMSFIVIVLGRYSLNGVDSSRLIYLLAISLFTSNFINFLRVTLEAVANFKISSLSIVIDRLSYLFLIVILLLKGNATGEKIVIAELIGKFISLIITIYYFKEVIFIKAAPIKTNFLEAWENIKVGINLTLSNISNMLIIGVVRFGIEKAWSIATFAKISLILNISNLITKFVNTIGLVLFPYLRTTESIQQSTIYDVLRTIYTTSVFISFLMFYPLRDLMTWWLPKYSDGLIYMSIIFPISLFQGKMALIINPFFKALRLERKLLKINFLTLGISVMFTFITVIVLQNLYLAISSIIVVLLIRSFIAEYILSKILSLNYLTSNITESLVIIIFSLLGVLTSTPISMLIYTFALFIYIYVNKSTITKALSFMKIYFFS